MKIGNGPLEFGIVGVSYNGELSIPILKELAIKTLNIHPLGKIFNVTDIEIVKCNKNDLGLLSNDILGELRARQIKFEKSLDIVGVIRDNIYSMGFYDILYSQPDNKILAHELGHVLGLNHPSFYCPSCNNKNQKTCSYNGYIMGCGLNDNEISEFSPEDIEKLEEWYLK